MSKQMLIAGFGGQGVLFAGKFLAYAGLIEGKELSWLPSYGPEMRGGTANCSVILSDTKVGSPIVDKPDILVALNKPSLEKYESAVVPGGQIYVDSSLIDIKVSRTDVEVYYIPASKIASDENLSGLANMIMMGHMIKYSEVVKPETIEKSMTKIVSAKKQNLFDMNLKAVDIGYNYKEA